jgi:uncharacterized lipoprotein YddW (UPF0748 family)
MRILSLPLAVSLLGALGGQSLPAQALASPESLSLPSRRIDAVNPTGGEFPGGRGPHMLVIYTPECGRPTTGTNAHGCEAVVRDGIVQSFGSNDSPIPGDGYVISGHGRGADWINIHLPPGTAVTQDGHEVRIDTSPAGQVAGLRYRMADIMGRINQSIATEEVLSEADHLSIAVNHLGGRDGTNDAGQLDDLAARVSDLEAKVWALELSGLPSPAGEVRAAWHRMTETTPEAIAQLAQNIAECHMNAFFPETIYGSQAIFNDTTGLYTKFAKFGDTDGLATLIAECHARGIQVHAWVHCFFIGIQGDPDEPALLAERHPDWLAQDREGNQISSDEHRYMYFNPAQPEARRAMIDAYAALVRNYSLDGLQLDYIRYAGSNSWQRLWDYSDFTRRRVREELGFDPMDATPDASPEEWARWLQWREEQITSFVREVSRAVRAVKPDIEITAAVFPDLQSAIENKGQNWAAWGREGLVDALMPMAYFTDPAAVARATREMGTLLPPGSPRVVGLAPFLNLTPRQTVDQILAAREAGATGECLFCWDRLTLAHRQALAAGPWRTVTPAAWAGAPEP